MTGFQVDLDDLTAFGALVSGYAQNAEDVSQYILDYEADDTADRYGAKTSNSTLQSFADTNEEVAGQGVFAYLIGKHQEYRDEAQNRCTYLNEASGSDVRRRSPRWSGR